LRAWLLAVRCEMLSQTIGHPFPGSCDDIPGYFLESSSSSGDSADPVWIFLSQISNNPPHSSERWTVIKKNSQRVELIIVHELMLNHIRPVRHSSVPPATAISRVQTRQTMSKFESSKPGLTDTHSRTTDSTELPRPCRNSKTPICPPPLNGLRSHPTCLRRAATPNHALSALIEPRHVTAVGTSGGP
jgi:hypothetical protein